jgi:membrane fusion protein (multidrug efflux system)
MTASRARHLSLSLRRLLLLAILSLLAGFGCDKPAPPPPPPAEVTTIKVEPRTVPLSTEFVAQIESSHQVEILARVSGFLDKILYKEGEVVKAGQVMFKIDPKPF